MKYLLIANSFGENLTRFANGIAKANGLDLDLYSLYIGGCSLESHWVNIVEDNKDYQLIHNGVWTDTFLSIKDALEMGGWDVISLQQASHMSPYIDTYYPYFENIYNYVKKFCPKATIAFQQTWAYSPFNPFKYQEVPNFYNRFDMKNAAEMKAGIDKCYKQICKEFNIDLIIRSGDVVEKACQLNKDPYDEYGFHMNDFGCYLIGCNFVKTLLGKKLENIFINDKVTPMICEDSLKIVNNNF